jgi:hypothetical protein
VALCRDDVAAVVGDIEPDLLDRIVATGATMAEIAQAVVEIERELGFDDHHQSPSPRVAVVRALLEPVYEHRDNISRGRD